MMTPRRNWTKRGTAQKLKVYVILAQRNELHIHHCSKDCRLLKLFIVPRQVPGIEFQLIGCKVNLDFRVWGWGLRVWVQGLGFI